MTVVHCSVSIFVTLAVIGRGLTNRDGLYAASRRRISASPTGTHLVAISIACRGPKALSTASQLTGTDPCRAALMEHQIVYECINATLDLEGARWMGFQLDGSVVLKFHVSRVTLGF